ncbi:hypothetical protein [Dyadobacter luticola]|uniref:Uncharacterized protein n=1 Tax=Dyadobacter luticola TaxID=1979387 RepID=A0A5R9KWH3_9BACT|nr:hypothetical protein [Dyadobacter luticola]TLV00488.1 hypothetical protein FEN17_13450 [Dyadobacter luticola]
MQAEQNQNDRQSAAEALLVNYINRDVDLIEVERMHNDMVLHYFRPADGWNPSYEHKLEAFYNAEIVTRLLRELSAFGKKG